MSFFVRDGVVLSAEGDRLMIMVDLLNAGGCCTHSYYWMESWVCCDLVPYIFSSRIFSYVYNCIYTYIHIYIYMYIHTLYIYIIIVVNSGAMKLGHFILSGVSRVLSDIDTHTTCIGKIPRFLW